MVDFPFEGTLVPAQQGGKIARAGNVENDSANQSGALEGAADVQTALNRIDSTGIGADIFTFSGPYAAQGSNIDEWFNNRQVSRLRCISAVGATGSTISFTLPGAIALGTAFDALVSAGIAERIEFVIEYTGPTSHRLQVTPRAGVGNPVITGTTSVLVATGIQARFEITRTAGVISDFIHTDISQIVAPGTGAFDALKFQNPATVNWDASEGGTLPSANVVKGNAYKVFNAPADGSGRFDEVMENGDWVVWEGETFTSWSATPHQWFVIPAHQVRRITALGQDFLADVAITPSSDRNGVVRGANYADEAGEIRLKIYATVADYSAADLNTNGDVDEYTDASDQTGYLAIRLPGTQTTLEDVLPTLYIYAEDGSGNFTRLLNMGRDFNFLGDFGAESDYISNGTIDYSANDTIRIYVGAEVDRYSAPNLDIFMGNLSDDLQSRIGQEQPWFHAASVLFSDSEIVDESVADRIEYTEGYSHGVDWRDMAQTTTINANRYLDSALNITVNHAAFTITGFGGNTLQKVCGLKLQRNDAATGNNAMMEIGSGQAFIRVTTSNQIQINTAVGVTEATWATLTDGNGAVTLGSGSNNFLVFELVPIETSTQGAWEIIAAFFDGTNYSQCNNLTFIPTGAANGDNLGFSRSEVQRGQVLEFRAINSPGYLTHSQLEQLIRNHVNDKWDFGFARLFQGTSADGTVIKRLVFQSPDGTNFAIGVGNDGALTTTELT